jgi:hypothetical protein
VSSTYCKILISLEDFNWGWLICVKDIPVVNCSICHQAQRCLAEPLPENHVLVHCRRLQLCLGTEVEYLEGSGLCLERNNLLRPVHNGTIGFDGSPNDIVGLFKVDDNDFGLRGFIFLFSYTYEGIRFECLRLLSAIHRGWQKGGKYSRMS